MDVKKPEGIGPFASVDDAMRHARWAFHRAKQERSSISTDPEHPSNSILRLHGMSGYMYRHLLNNICARELITYSEVGSWHGSTFLSAVYNNPRIMARTCDNWSQFGGQKNVFLNNYLDVKNLEGQIEIFETAEHAIHESDFRELDFTEQGQIDIYFFDGPHTREDQRDGILCAWEALAPISIILVDDWNLESARVGTFAALDQVQANIHMQIEMHSPPEGWLALHRNKQARTRFETSEWHNGIALFVVSK